METTIACWAYIGIMEKKLEATVVYWGYIGIMEKKLETTIVCKRLTPLSISGFRSLGFCDLGCCSLGPSDAPAMVGGITNYSPP